MKFEWDNNKAEENLVKHGVAFELSREVFTDIYAIDLYDADHSFQDESRFIRIGLAQNNVLLVIYVVRDEQGETYRIISARRAEKVYESLYWNQRTEIQTD